MTRTATLARRAVAIALVAGAAALAGACGGGDGDDEGAAPGTTTAAAGPGEVRDDPEARAPRGSSVANGLGGPPEIAAQVRDAAAAAGCEVRGLPADGEIQPDGTLHIEGEPDYRPPLPPSSGLHNAFWADWGMYDIPVPNRYLMHNLEHGGVIIHLGRALSPEARGAVQTLWAGSPPYLVVAPGAEGVPPRGLVAVSWQRRLECVPFEPSDVTALRAFRDAYRGTGPEAAPAVNVPADVGRPDDLPRPARPDPGA